MIVTDGSDGDTTVTGVPYDCYWWSWGGHHSNRNAVWVILTVGMRTSFEYWLLLHCDDLNWWSKIKEGNGGNYVVCLSYGASPWLLPVTRPDEHHSLPCLTSQTVRSCSWLRGLLILQGETYRVIQRESVKCRVSINQVSEQTVCACVCVCVCVCLCLCVSVCVCVFV